MSNIETIVRQCLCGTLKRPPDQATSLDLDDDLVYGYGLASLDLIMLMTAVCSDAGVPLTNLDTDDLSRLRKPSDIVALLVAKASS